MQVTLPQRWGGIRSKHCRSTSRNCRSTDAFYGVREVPKSGRNVKAMQWGHEHEEDAAFEYCLSKYGFDESAWPVYSPGIVIDYNRKLAASPDRFVGEDGIS